MNKRLILAWFVLAAFCVSDYAWAQFNDPRAYENTPVATNQIELGYTYVHANASIDAALPVPDAKLNLNQGSVGYTRYFSLLSHVAWVDAGIPVANLTGSI